MRTGDLSTGQCMPSVPGRIWSLWSSGCWLTDRQTDSHFHFPLVCVMVSRLFSSPREADFVFRKMEKNWRSFHHMAGY